MQPIARTTCPAGCARNRRSSRRQPGSPARTRERSDPAKGRGSWCHPLAKRKRARPGPGCRARRKSTRCGTWAAANCGGNSGREAKPSAPPGPDRFARQASTGRFPPSPSRYGAAARARVYSGRPPGSLEESLSPLRALVFDAYGTLFDVHSVIALCEQLWPGKGAALSQLWRTKQLEYTDRKSLMRRYEDFARVTEAGLRYACAALDLRLDEDRRHRLIDAYLGLATFPEVGNALAELKTMKLKLAILSNGSPAMLRPVVENAGLRSLIGTVISVDRRKIYKPAPAVYRLALQGPRVPKKARGLFSSNRWGACGAKAFGCRAFWVNRA